MSKACQFASLCYVCLSACSLVSLPACEPVSDY
jgi:hypothetical protein